MPAVTTSAGLGAGLVWISGRTVEVPGTGLTGAGGAVVVGRSGSSSKGRAGGWLDDGAVAGGADEAAGG